MNDYNFFESYITTKSTKKDAAFKVFAVYLVLLALLTGGVFAYKYFTQKDIEKIKAFLAQEDNSRVLTILEDKQSTLEKIKSINKKLPAVPRAFEKVEIVDRASIDAIVNAFPADAKLDEIKIDLTDKEEEAEITIDGSAMIFSAIAEVEHSLKRHFDEKIVFLEKVELDEGALKFRILINLEGVGVNENNK